MQRVVANHKRLLIPESKFEPRAVANSNERLLISRVDANNEWLLTQLVAGFFFLKVTMFSWRSYQKLENKCDANLP